MACLLKAPGEGSKGIVVFTTQERDHAIKVDPSLRATIETLKSRWLIGLHHNWHDHQFKRDALFDFSMAGEGDLMGDPVPLVTVDACNFVPPEFRPGGDPFWDVLYVTRAVFFKDLPRLLETIRALYDAGRSDRVLCVCAMPARVDPRDGSVIHDIEERYQRMFSAEERRLFTLWTLHRDYPFPLDLPTLAHLYRSSRVFVHFAIDERRCRVAAYAWAAGLPVVASEAVGSLLAPALRGPPVFYAVEDPAQFPARLAEALDAPRAPDAHLAAAAQFEPIAMQAELRRQLAAHFPEAGVETDGFVFAGLGIRLGRHHGMSTGPNRVEMTVAELADLLATDEGRVCATMRHDRDPELVLAASAPGSREADRSRAGAGVLGRLRLRLRGSRP
jgi:glycosyltransferase involved in cell wall biosynthesis